MSLSSAVSSRTRNPVRSVVVAGRQREHGRSAIEARVGDVEERDHRPPSAAILSLAGAVTRPVPGRSDRIIPFVASHSKEEA
jgi:hypothetical protein